MMIHHMVVEISSLQILGISPNSPTSIKIKERNLLYMYDIQDGYRNLLHSLQINVNFWPTPQIKIRHARKNEKT